MVSGYINTKINAGLDLNKNLLMEADYVAKHIVDAGNSFTIVTQFQMETHLFNFENFAGEFGGEVALRF